MKKTIQILVIILLTIILFTLIVAIFNPFNLRNKFVAGVINGMLESQTELTDGNTVSEPIDENYGHPLLSTDQEQTLSELGVDVANIPTTISPEMETCLVNAVGEERAMEIVNGSTPTAIEIVKASGCL